jgi:hypothetical protein
VRTIRSTPPPPGQSRFRAAASGHPARLFPRRGAGTRRTDDRTFFSELRLIDPEVVVVLGTTAGRALLGLPFQVTKDDQRIQYIRFDRALTGNSALQDPVAGNSGWRQSPCPPPASRSDR